DVSRDQGRWRRHVVAVADLDDGARVAVRATARVDAFDGQHLEFEEVRLADVADRQVAGHERGQVVDLRDAVGGLTRGLLFGPAAQRVVGQREPQRASRASTARSTISRVMSSFSIFVLPYAKSMRCSRDGTRSICPAAINAWTFALRSS